jgi:hypothetical protein
MNEVTTSVKMSVELRHKLEKIRFSRASDTGRLPRLRELVLEALREFVISEENKASSDAP